MTSPSAADSVGGEEDRGVQLARIRGELADLAREAHDLATGAGDDSAADERPRPAAG
jgi:hypothetical protein